MHARCFGLTDRSRFSALQTAATMALGLVAGGAAHLAHDLIPKTNESVFYSLEFVLNVALPYVIVSLVPYAVAVSSSAKAKSS